MRFLRIATLVAAGLTLSVPASALATTFTVTSSADSGAGSLRAALASAGLGDTVMVPAMTITLTSGELAVPAGVTIQGSGARTTILSGGNTSRVLNVGGAGVTISSVTITQGKTSQPGGGIDSNSGLTLSHVALVNNQSSNGGGGADIAGGGPMIIDHSLIAGNQAPTGSGGGLVFSAGLGSSITDSTITGNTASGAAGGIYIEATGLLLNADTIVGNVLTGAGGQGGNLRDTSNFTMRDTILAGGVATSGGDCYMSSTGTWTSLGHNAEDTDATPDAGGPDTCQYYFTGPGDRTGLNLQLGALANNGGPTDTILPGAASPVLDTGDGANCTADDQRGVTRPQGAGCDVGAVERSTPGAFSGFAGSITTTGAVLQGTANTQGLAGTTHYEYGPSPSFGAVTPDVALAATVGSQAATATIGGLAPGTTYYFALIVTTADGSVTAPATTFKTTATTTTVPIKKPSPKPAVCKVPKLHGRSLAAAKRALKTAHCALGKVGRPKHSHGTLVVLSQGGKAGTTHKAGYKVSVKLGPPPKPRKPTKHRRAG